MTVEVKSGGIWRTITAPKVKFSGAWRAIRTIEVKSGGVWRTVFLIGPPVVSAAADGDFNLRVNNPCYAGVQFQTSGLEKEYTNTGGLGPGGGDGIWLDSGLSSDVWVERIVTAGSWNDIDPGAGRHNLATTRSFRILRTPVGIRTVTGFFKFWDAASGGNLLQQTASASYTAENSL